VQGDIATDHRRFLSGYRRTVSGRLSLRRTIRLAGRSGLGPGRVGGRRAGRYPETAAEPGVSARASTIQGSQGIVFGRPRRTRRLVARRTPALWKKEQNDPSRSGKTWS
jgi:hypothetical protein